MTPKPIADPNRESRLQRFESMAYGLFLHWGLYSLLERGEWNRFHNRLDPKEYDSLVERFTAENFDAPALVAWAQSCGFRYICLTSRHHEGFSLYDTRGLNTFDAPHSPAGRDLVAEFASACQQAGMGFFLYHTTLDWWEPRFENDWKGYIAYLRDSVRILCTHYGKLDGLWFDGNWSKPEADWEEDALYSMIRELQPDCVIINNSSLQMKGADQHPALDSLTFEQGLPTSAARRRIAKEMCETLTSHWGIADPDYSHKSPAELIRCLVTCRGNGANLLLNAGPQADGRLTDFDRLTLERVGQWIRESLGDALYSARPAGVSASGKDQILAQGNNLLYCAYELPIADNMHHHTGPQDWDRRTVLGSIPAVRRITWQDSDEELEFSQDVDKGLLVFRAKPHPYGAQRVVRIARIELQNN